jgi:hypothetical protein
VINKSIIKTALIAFSLVLAFSVGTYAQKTDCTKTTDSEIVDAIYAKLDVKFETQTTHINVRVKDAVVTLEGWAVKEKDKQAIEKIVKKIKCVKSIVNSLTIGASGGCSTGQKPCGEICIDAAETCNIRVRKTAN